MLARLSAAKYVMFLVVYNLARREGGTERAFGLNEHLVIFDNAVYCAYLQLFRKKDIKSESLLILYFKAVVQTTVFYSEILKKYFLESTIKLSGF